MTRRILFVDCSLAHGGAQRSLYTLIAHLDRERFEPHLLCGNDSLQGLLKQCRSHDIEAGYIPIRTWRRTVTGVHRAVLDLMKAKPIMERWIAKHEVHALYANGIQSGLLCALVAPKDLPLIFHCRDARGPKTAMERVMRRSRRTIMISDFLQQRWAARCPAQAQKMVRIYNGFDFTQMAKLRHQLNYREERGWSKETLIVSMIADLVEWKRHDLFITAFAELRKRQPDAFAFIIGAPRDEKGEVYEQRLLALSEQLGQTAHIAFTGHVENPFPLIDASDIMVSVAEDEPFGRNVVEALFCGKPMVITPGGGPAEIAADCPAVTLAEPTPVALAEATLAWHTTDRIRLLQMGEAAHHAALRFDLPRHLRQVGDVIDGVLTAK